MNIQPLWVFFWDEPFLSRLYEIYLSIKDLDNLAEFNLLQNLHLCTQKSVCATNFGSLGEISANFSLQLSSRTQFAKINNKKVIAENQCEKHKKSRLGWNCYLSEFRLHSISYARMDIIWPILYMYWFLQDLAYVCYLSLLYITELLPLIGVRISFPFNIFRTNGQNFI